MMHTNGGSLTAISQSQGAASGIHTTHPTPSIKLKNSLHHPPLTPDLVQGGRVSAPVHFLTNTITVDRHGNNSQGIWQPQYPARLIPFAKKMIAPGDLPFRPHTMALRGSNPMLQPTVSVLPFTGDRNIELDNTMMYRSNAIAGQVKKSPNAEPEVLFSQQQRNSGAGNGSVSLENKPRFTVAKTSTAEIHPPMPSATSHPAAGALSRQNLTTTNLPSQSISLKMVSNLTQASKRDPLDPSSQVALKFLPMHSDNNVPPSNLRFKIFPGRNNHISHPEHPLPMQNKSTKFISEESIIASRTGTMKKVALLNQVASKQPVNVSTPDQFAGIQSFVHGGIESKREASRIVLHNTMQPPSRQLPEESRLDAVANSNIGNEACLLNSSKSKEDLVATNLLIVDIASKQSPAKKEKLSCRFRELLLSSDDDSDDVSCSISKNPCPTEVETERADNVCSSQAGLVSHNGENTIPTVETHTLQTRVNIETKEKGGSQASKEITTPQSATEAPENDSDSRQTTQPNIGLQITEFEVSSPYDRERVHRNPSPHSPPRSVSSTSPPASVLMAENDSKDINVHHSQVKALEPNSLDSKRKQSSEMSKKSISSRHKTHCRPTSFKPSKKILAQRKRRSERYDLEISPKRSHFSPSLRSSNTNASIHACQQRKRKISSSATDHFLKRTRRQRQLTGLSRKVGAKSDDLVSKDAVSSTTLSNNKGAKKEITYSEDVSPLLNIKASDLYRFYDILRKIEHMKKPYKPSRNNISAPKGRATRSSPSLRTLSSHTAISHSHPSTDTHKSNRSLSLCGQKRQSQEKQFLNANLSRAPWRCGAKDTSSNPFPAPSPLCRPLGYINSGGGFYEPVGYNPSTRRRLRRTLQEGHVSGLSEMRNYETTGTPPKNSDLSQIMRAQGHATVRGAQCHSLKQDKGTKCPETRTHTIPSLDYLNVSAHRSARGLDEFSARPVKLGKSSHVEAYSSDSIHHRPHPYYMADKAAHRLISPSPSTEDFHRSPISNPSADQQGFNTGYATTDPAKYTVKTIHHPLGGGLTKQMEGTHGGFNSDKKRLSDVGSTLGDDVKEFLEGQGYSKDIMTCGQPFNRKVSHSYPPENASDLHAKPLSSSLLPKDSNPGNKKSPTRRSRGLGKELEPSSWEMATGKRRQRLPDGSNEHGSTMQLPATLDSCSPRRNQIALSECSIIPYATSDTARKKVKRIRITAKPASVEAKHFRTSLPFSEHRVKSHVSRAALRSYPHVTQEAVDSLTCRMEIDDPGVGSSKGLGNLSEHDLVNCNIQDKAQVSLARKSMLDATREKEISYAKDDISHPKQRTGSAPLARVGPETPTRVHKTPSSRIASRPIRRKDKVTHKTKFCSEWIDDVLSSIALPNKSLHAKSGKTSNSVTERAPSVGAFQHIGIPVVDMRKQFKPVTVKTLTNRTSIRKGHSSQQSCHSCSNEGSRYLDSSPLRPYFRTIHFEPRARLQSARSMSPHLGRKQNFEEKSSSRDDSRQKRAGNVRKVVMQVPNGMPYEAYSTIKVKNPNLPSPWARASNPRGDIAQVPGKPVARRIVPEGSTFTPSETAHSRMSSPNTATLPRNNMQYRLVQEVHLDEYSRPYVIIKEIPTGAAAKEQKQSVDRLSRPKTIFIRAEDVSNKNQE